MLLFHIWNYFFFFFPFERGAHVGMHAHTHTRGHYFDSAETIAIVLAYEWKNWDSVSTSQVF